MSAKDWESGQLVTIRHPGGAQEHAKVVAVGRRFVSVQMGQYTTKFNADEDPPTWVGQITKAIYTLHTRNGKTA